MNISVASTLLVTHSRFADVYSLFEETMELLPESKVNEFMADVGDIRSKLDRWKTYFSYEKEKKTFLVAKCHARSVAGSGRDESSQEGFSVAESSCATPRSRPSSEQRHSSSLNNGTTPPPDEVALEDTLPLVLEHESDETWLLTAPAPISTQSASATAAADPVVDTPEEKTHDSLPLLSIVQSNTKELESHQQQQQQQHTQSNSSLPSSRTTTPVPTGPTPAPSKSASSLKSRIPKPPPSPKRGVFSFTLTRTASANEERERKAERGRN